MKTHKNQLIIIGAGLAGSEAAYQAAKRGASVLLYEMRPVKMTPAHSTDNLAELVCSNSLGSKLYDRVTGLLINELKILDSLLIKCAELNSVPAGGALAVDRGGFSACVTKQIIENPNIILKREEVINIPKSTTIIATGPLTSPNFSKTIANFTGKEHLYFFDAMSPIVVKDSIDFEKAFMASRYGRGETEKGDYINCPLTKNEYETFVNELISADRIKLHEFEIDIESGVSAGHPLYFEGCLPIEVIASRGKDTLAFGPMRPVGLTNPHTSQKPYAIVQLRQDNLSGDMYNIVGFQTNLTFQEQRRVLRLIPGLENVEFVRYGQMHRNTFVFSPGLLLPTFQTKKRKDLFFAGQITGIEGYVGNIASGLLAGLNASRILHGIDPIVLPKETMLGALSDYITSASPAVFQPMKANFGLLPPLNTLIKGRKGKRQRAKAYSDRSISLMTSIARGIN